MFYLRILSLHRSFNPRNLFHLGEVSFCLYTERNYMRNITFISISNLLTYSLRASEDCYLFSRLTIFSSEQTLIINPNWILYSLSGILSPKCLVSVERLDNLEVCLVTGVIIRLEVGDHEVSGVYGLLVSHHSHSHCVSALSQVCGLRELASYTDLTRWPGEFCNMLYASSPQSSLSK